ncbi:MAG TPA: transketolase [Blastocatellia bacterium]|nr:transketolase [Blastocatellia bacterium]HMY72857.1 transketolase [Blastocatellia bacterium]HMZ18675.1 transketolase [Blastocatellia bacterium]HNG28995.1 transketolase [Blastocatellia bacterium]
MSHIGSALKIRRIILEQSKRARVGHIGSALSIADIIASLYGQVLHLPSPNDPERDRFVLSKGHAALALYSALFLKGWISREELDTFCGDGSMLGVHPESVLPGVDFSTGSLGQGLSMGAGAALAAKLSRSSRRVFVLLSDAECNEGSVWEAIMFAAHHRLSNLIAIVDLNGQQAFGYTDQVLKLSPMADRWRAFDWDVHEVNGHDEMEIAETIAGLSTDTGSAGRPHVLIARTTFGKGVSYMENQIKWHYWPMSDQEYQQAMSELGEQA